MKRLEYNANCFEDIAQYFQTRARQLLMEGFVWDKTLVPVLGGFETSFQDIQSGQIYGSFYGINSERGHGYAREAFKRQAPILTVSDCHIVDFLKQHHIPHLVKGAFLETPEYQLISQYYGDKTARRSGCFLMNHIDEGLFVLTHFGATLDAKKAFCLHPMLQMDEDLAQNWEQVRQTTTPTILALAMEYRNIANQYLSKRSISSLHEIQLSPLPEVNDMLRADKVQNYKDFLIYHQHTHERASILDQYFRNWLCKLNISSVEFEQLQTQLIHIEKPFLKPNPSPLKLS